MIDDVLVIGSGVIGLTTAVLLAEAGWRVLVRTSDPAAATTSAVAGALLGPVVAAADERVQGWLAHGDTVFRRLAEDPETGVRIARGRLFGSRGGGLPRWATTAPGFAPAVGPDQPAGFGTTFWVELPVADMRYYLPYLTRRLAAAGGRIESGHVPSLTAAATVAPIVVNCAGAAAGALTADDDLHPLWGQHVIVANPGLHEFLFEGGPPGSSWASWFPHGDRVVLGGIAIPHRWDRSADAEVTQAILDRVAALEPRLAGARVLGVEVGLRPARSRARVEMEELAGCWVVHQYGHAGNGVQWSWGTARDAVALVVEASGRLPRTGKDH